jgi:hypothetical protein
LAELGLAAHGRWKGSEPRGEFKVEAGVVRGTVLDEDAVPAETTGSIAPEADDDPWLEGVVPARVAAAE